MKIYNKKLYIRCKISEIVEFYKKIIYNSGMDGR